MWGGPPGTEADAHVGLTFGGAGSGDPARTMAPAPPSSERELSRHLQDPRIQRAGDLSEGRRPVHGVDARRTGQKAGERDAGAEAVGHVEGFGANLKSVTFVNWELPGDSRIPSEEAGAGNIVAARSTECTRRGRSESLRIDPTTRTWVGAQRIRQYLDWPLVPAIAVQSDIGRQVSRNPICRRVMEDLREFPVRQQPRRPQV